MANFTKKAIKDTFIELLNERPLSQITVKDIVEKCALTEIRLLSFSRYSISH